MCSDSRIGSAVSVQQTRQFTDTFTRATAQISGNFVHDGAGAPGAPVVPNELGWPGVAARRHHLAANAHGSAVAGGGRFSAEETPRGLVAQSLALYAKANGNEASDGR